MEGESVYQIQVGWSSMKDNSSFKVGCWELLWE